MSACIRVALSPGEVRVAVLRDGRLVDYAIWRPGAPDGVGDLHRGRVIARVPAMAGAFVELEGAEGFLPDSEGAAGLGQGAAVPVRVTRAAQGGKGPRLSARLTDEEQAVIGAAAAEGRPALLRPGPDAVQRLRHLYPEASVVRGVGFDDALEGEIEALGQPVVALPAGGRLSVHPTPALVAIDLDAGGATAERRGKAAAQMGLNRAALPEIARQIRLRDLSGAILVDLAGLSVRKRAGLGPALASALAADPLGPRLLGFTALGLAEILRPRVHPPLHELLAGPHAAGLAALRRLAAEAAADPAGRRWLRAAPAVVSALLADPVALGELERRTGRTLMLRSDPALPADAWVMENEHG